MTLLRRQLAVIADRGYAVEVEEVLPGFGSVAVPVADPEEAPYAAVSATVSVERLAVQQLVPALRTTAAGIARAVDRRVLADAVESPPLRVAAG
jgi:DNA-binding IclR family transcriptional regulator